MRKMNTLIDLMFTNREQRRELEKKIEDLKNQYVDIETELIETMDHQGVDRASGEAATASVSEVVKPNVEDWETFYKYIKRHNAFWLLERRPSVTACRELFDTKGKIPGVVPFTKRSINLRTRN